MKVGYARLSTDEQTLALQHDALRADGCEAIHEDKGICRPPLPARHDFHPRLSPRRLPPGVSETEGGTMDGKGAWRDNVFVERLWRSVKYEEIYLRAYDTVSMARVDRPVSRLLQRTHAPFEP